MSNNIEMLITGFSIGFIFWFMVVVFNPGDIHIAGVKAIEQCEATLPRNQHCKITAEIDNGK